MNQKLISLVIIFSLFSIFCKAQSSSKESPYGVIHADAPKALSDYAPMIGICDCKSVSRNPQGTWQDTIDLTWQFKYILKGLAVQDETWDSANKYATSIRQYNTDSLKWYVTYYSNNFANPSPTTWAGKKEANKDIVLWAPQKAPNGMEGYSRLTFGDIDAEGFNWRGEWVNEDQSIVYPFWLIFCKKRKE